MSKQMHRIELQLKLQHSWCVQFWGRGKEAEGEMFNFKQVGSMEQWRWGALQDLGRKRHKKVSVLT
jgi:hypothetical protein